MKPSTSKEDTSAKPSWNIDRQSLFLLALIFILWRLVVLGIGTFSDVTIARDPDGPQQAERGGLEIWRQSGVSYYVDIADDGYTTPALAVLSPLFPLTMRAGHALLAAQLPYEQVGMLVNLLTVPSLMAVMYALTKHHLEEGAAKRSVFYLLLFPAAVFLAIPYPEALFLLLALSAFLFAERGNWPAAGGVGALAAASHLAGIFLLPCLVMIYLGQHPWRRPGIAWMWLTLIPTGLAFHGWMLERAGYDWWLFLKAIGREDLPLVELGTLAFAVTVAPFVWRLLPKAYFVFTALLFILAISANSLFGANRLVFVMFPLFIVIGYLGKNQLLDRLYITLGGMGLGLFTAMFVTGYWVG